MKKRIFMESYALEELEKLNPQAVHKYQSLSNFDWIDSTLDQQTKVSIEEILVHSMILLPGINLTSASTMASKLNWHPLTLEQHIAKVFQLH